MAFVHGREGRVVFNEFDLSCFFNNVDMSREADTPEVTTFCDDFRAYITGFRGATLSFSGFYDPTTTTGSDEILANSIGATNASIVSYAPNGFAVGEPIYLFRTHSTGYSVSQPVDGVVSITADMNATGTLVRGFSLHQLAAETTTANGTSVDGTASTTTGWTAHLHVTAVSGGTPTLDVDVADSANDTTFATVTGASFTQVTTSPSSERLTSSTSTATVRRYVRAEWTISGSTPSYTFTVTFARQ